MNEAKTFQEILDSAPHDYLKNFNIEYIDDDVSLISGIELRQRDTSIKVIRNVFYFCHNGTLELETADAPYTIHAGETFFCPTGTYVKLKYYEPTTKFSVLALTDRIVQSLLSTNMHIWNNIVYVLKERIIRPEQGADARKESRVMWHYAKMMNILLQFKDHPFQKQMIYLMLQMGLLSLCAYYNEPTEQASAEPPESGTSQAQIIFTKFMELLQNETIKHRPVYFYADKLCISSKYLSYVCKLISGKAASDFIRSAVIGDIMHYLENTTLSVKEISNIMGFPNVSFFGKYVKTHLGVSPNKYRK